MTTRSGRTRIVGTSALVGVCIAIVLIGSPRPASAQGAVRSWEAAIRVSPFSSYNLLKKNLLTEIPLVAFDPVGPPVAITLYHNSLSASLQESGAADMGFSLGNGWSMSYSGRVVPGTNRGVAMAARGRWLVDGEGEPYNYQRLAAWEFAYEDPRARYMARELDAGTLVPSGPAAWTDYLGTSPWGDFDLTYSGSTPVVSEQMRYLGTAAQQDVSGGDTRHYHGDLIGSTMLLTDEAGGTNFSPASFAYTAFGEPVTPDGSGGWRVGQPVSGAPRYAYAGQWGYETWHDPSGPMFLAGANPNLAPIRLSHVGARWYDAAIGRFVQRDPIGLLGGLNTYAYCYNSPLYLVDPSGRFIISTIVGGIVGGVVGGICGGWEGGAAGAIGGAVGGAVTGAMTGAGISPPIAGAVGGAVGGAVSGGLGGYAGGHGPGGIGAHAGVGAGIGALGGWFGGFCVVKLPPVADDVTAEIIQGGYGGVFPGGAGALGGGLIDLGAGLGRTPRRQVVDF